MKIVIRTIKFILEILPKNRQLNLIVVSGLLIVNSVLELIGLGALLPVFSVLLEDNVIEKYSWARWIYNLFNLTDERQLIVVLGIGLLIVIVIKNILSLLIAKIYSTFALNLSKEFSLKLHRYYYKEGFAFFKTTNSNVIMRNLRTATTQFANLQVLGTLNLLNELLVLLLIVIFISIYNLNILFLLIVTVLPPFYIFYRWVRIRSIRLGELSNKLTPIAGKNFFQSIFGYVDVVIMGAEESFRNKIKQNLNRLVDIDIKTSIYNQAPTKVIETSLMLAIVVIISFGIYFLPSKSDLIKLLGLFAVAGYRIMPSINRMMIAINGLNRSHWVFGILEPLKSVRVEDDNMKDEPITFTEKLVLENVTFKYPGSKNHTFKNLNLTINKGEVLGLIGPSGAGKTTLMNILLGFLKPEKGNYFIDSTKLERKNEKSFYKMVGYVQQQVYLIDGSIAENVAFGCKKNEIDYEKLNEAIKRANLVDMINDLPDGVNEMIGENGTKLSGGQRQRVGIARALYFDSQIIFLDEATSSLDSKTEKEITESIQQIADGNLTIIIIAHRMSTLTYCTRIVEINNNSTITEKSRIPKKTENLLEKK